MQALSKFAFSSVQLLIDTNGFSILPCNEFSIKTVNGHYAPSLL